MNRRGFLRTITLGFAGLTVAAKLRIDPTPVAPQAPLPDPDWKGLAAYFDPVAYQGETRWEEYFVQQRDRMQKAIYERLVSTDPYASLLGKAAYPRA